MVAKRRREAANSDWSVKVAAAGLIALAIIAPQALGGATPETALAILLGASFVSVLSAVAAYRRRTEMGVVPTAALAGLVALAWTIVQRARMPCSVIERLFPERFEIMTQLSELGALAAPRCTLSAAPGSTLIAIAMAATLSSLLLSAVTLVRCGARKTLTLTLAVSSATMAVVAIVHTIFTAETIFGVYTPRASKPGLLIAPLLNGNHLAGFLVLGFPVALSFGLAKGRMDARICWWVTALLIAACTCLTLSRGGILALVFAASAVAITFAAPRKSSYRRSPLVGGAALFVVALPLVLAGEDVEKEFRTDSSGLDKLEIIARVGSLVWEHPWLGIGRGALQDASPRVVQSTSWARYAESFPVQWAVEWGLPVTALILGLLTMSLIRARWRTSGELPVAIGLIALALQNLVDFGLELPAIAGVAAIALGVVVAREASTAATVRFPLPMTLAATSACSVLTVALAVPNLTTLARRNLSQQLESVLDNRAQFTELLTRGFHQYPIDPALIVVGATQAVRTRHPRSTKWLNLSMRAAPWWAAPHLQAAQLLIDRGLITQAAVELSFVADLDVNRWYEPACAFVRRWPREQLALNAAATRDTRLMTLEHLLRCVWDASPTAERLASLILTEFPKSVPAQIARANAAGKRGDKQAALALYRKAAAAHPQNPQAVASLIRALVDLGEPDEALTAFRGLQGPVSEYQAVLSAGAAAAVAKRDLDLLHRTLATLINRHGTSVSSRAELQVLASRLCSQAGDPMQALIHLKSAYEAVASPELAEMTYEAALKADVPGTALRMAKELCQVGRDPKRFCESPL